MQPQGKHLAHGQGNHPQINGQADGRIQPPIQINIDAYALCRIEELLPVEVDGDALENGARDKDQAVQDVEGHRGPQHGWPDGRGEEAQVEERDAQLDERDAGQVQNLHDVKVQHEAGDLGRCHGPDVPAEAVGGHAAEDNDQAGDADDQGAEDGPVVCAECLGRVEELLEHEACYGDDDGDDAESDDGVVEFCGSVSDGCLACCLRGIFRGCTCSVSWHLLLFISRSFVFFFVFIF